MERSKLKKYVMFEHAGSSNHGCEAIVRTTQKMLEGNEFYLQTFNPEQDKRYGIDKLAKLITIGSEEINPRSLQGMKMRVQSRLNPSLDYTQRDCLRRNKKLLIKNSVALSIGGDNYCYWGIILSMRDKLKAFEMKGIPTVLWGCSVDEKHLDQYTKEDLKRYALITARESLTIETLDKIGIRDTVVACADPAFTLERQAVSWNDEILSNRNVIGINVSDFMKKDNAYPNATYRNFYYLIEYILKNTDCDIAFIPHVRGEGNDDLMPMKELANEFNSNRIYCVEEDFNCMQLKDIIARCRMFIGCRTHSTIAAYSTCVPTLVVGYSIKARGICKDLFGEYENFLMDVREFKDDYDLVKKFQAFVEREDELRGHLQKIMPEYKQRAYLAKEAVEKL